MEHHNEQTIHISVGTIVKVVVVFLLFWFFYVVRDLLLVVLTSVVIASSIEPATQWLGRKRVPRTLAVILIYLLVALFIVGVLYFLLLPLLSESGDFLNNLPTYFNADTVSSSIDHNEFLSSQPLLVGLRNTIDLDQVVGQINVMISNISSGAFNTISSIFGGLMSSFLIVVLSFYLSMEKDGVGKFLKIVSPLKYESYIIDLWKRSQKKIGLWMQGQIILAVIVGVLVYLGLTLLNVPNALLLAFLAGIFEIIPMFGPILASIPGIAIAFISGGFTLALLVVGLYIIVQQFENQLIYPLVVKKVIGVSPIVSILALIAGGQIAGFLGLILAVPVAAVFIEFFDDLEKDKVEKVERMNNQN